MSERRNLLSEDELKIAAKTTFVTTDEEAFNTTIGIFRSNRFILEMQNSHKCCYSNVCKSLLTFVRFQFHLGDSRIFSCLWKDVENNI
ncbi:hypothetical protein PH210_09870 [Paenibacillus sp. BSR1-1]|uniref:hypothetical protein n=1 Tax=Paenibacillus sp. BSR1-1 TaxID=3020845 RepID=UPI0025B09B21|nr:hypothetical protein [Paenibacillus sp. BSR1-1]MDN3016508.1 hypothetical protein [Paenibacillus sp. BSR1-1]